MRRFLTVLTLIASIFLPGLGHAAPATSYPLVAPTVTHQVLGLDPSTGYVKRFSVQGILNLTYSSSKSTTIENPSSSEDMSLWSTDYALTVKSIKAVVRGSTPSVTYTIRHALDRSDTGTEVVTGGSTVTSETTGDKVLVFDDATIPADSFIWLETTAVSGTVDEFNITINFQFD